MSTDMHQTVFTILSILTSLLSLSLPEFASVCQSLFKQIMANLIKLWQTMAILSQTLANLSKLWQTQANYGKLKQTIVCHSLLKFAIVA